MHRHDRELIVQIANRGFGDFAKAQDWLNQPRVQLGGRTPMEMLGTETGARRVEELLTQIEDDKHLDID
jgi:putative toxin-antitoxin system antitoxin component (TIGR02293 family)